jgi:hypothetical protein
MKKLIILDNSNGRVLVTEVTNEFFENNDPSMDYEFNKISEALESKLGYLMKEQECSWMELEEDFEIEYL